MDDKTTKSDQTAKAVKVEAAYELASLREHSRELFGVSVSTFDGATSGLDRSKKYTKSKIKNIIEEWGKTPIGLRKESE